jgi:protein-disulfide isomerase
MRSIRETLLSIATVIVVICTVTLTSITVYRQLFATPRRTALEDRRPVMLDGWRELASVGHRIGPDSADVTVIVFSDFECPMCATFATATFPDFRTRHPDRTALVYRHWPLSQHRFAYPAARASECAAEQGRFAQFHDLIYSKQRQLGLTSFRQFAADAGIRDLAAFDACYARTDPVASIERDIETVTRIGGTGTPTVVVNGWLLRGGVGPALLDSIARQFLTHPAGPASR